MTTTVRPETPSPPETPGPQGSRLWAALHPILLRLHFYAGILVGPFLVLAATTGLLYTLAPVVERTVHADLLTVEAADEHAPLSHQVGAARGTHPEGTIAQVDVAADPTQSTRVTLAVDGLPEGAAWTVFVDPATTEVLGASLTYGDWMPERRWLETLHSSLHLGEVGHLYSELAASWLWVVALGGLIMWVARARRKRRTVRALLVPETTARGRRRTLSWHGVIGVLAALGMLVLSVTGLTWSEHAGDRIRDLRTAVSAPGPVLETSLDGASHGGGHVDHGASPAQGLPDIELAHGAGWDGVAAVAAAEGLTAPYRVVTPLDHDHAWTVVERQRAWPADNTELAVDGHDGTVVDRVDFADRPFLAQLTTWGINFHFGQLFGLANMIFLAATAVAVVVLVVLGYRMWWQRRPTRSTSWGPGPLVPRGSLRRAPVGLVVGLFVLAAVAAYYVPVFGITLVAFLVVDVLLGLRSRLQR